MPHVYIVRCADDTLYTGWAMDLARRVEAHNAGRGARYTRIHGPVALVYAEEVPTRGAALRRERVIKRYPRVRKLALCGPEIALPPSGRRGVQMNARPTRAKPATRKKPASRRPGPTRSARRTRK